MFHLNMSSLQNKFDELKLLNDKMKSQIIFSLREKDRHFLPEQPVHLNGLQHVSKRQREGGVGMIAYFDSSLPSKDLKVTKRYKTLEILAVEASLGNNEVIFLGIYRP